MRDERAEAYARLADAVDNAGLERDEKLFLVYYLVGAFKDYSEDCVRDIQARGGGWDEDRTFAYLKAGEMVRAADDIREILAAHLF